MNILIVLFILICSIGFLQIDDAPSEEVASFVSLVESRMQIESEAYLYLNGMAVPEGQDVISEGNRLLVEYERSLSDEILPSNKKANNVLGKNEGSYFNCMFLSQACLVNIMKNSDSWQYEMNRGSEVLARYDKFISYTEFTTMTRPSVKEIILNYSYIAFGNHLKVLSILSLVKSKHHKEAFFSLNEDNNYLRKHIEITDNLIHKMVFVSLLANNLDVMVYLSSINAINDFQKISLLSVSEIDMTLPLSREFIMGHDMLLELDGSPEIFELGGGVPYWLVRAMFKPYMIMNDSVSGYSELIRLSKLTSKEFAKSVKLVGISGKSNRSFRNYIGSVLNEISIPNYFEYIARMHDLNCKITLINEVFSAEGGKLNNPYGSNFDAREAKGNLICMGGPLEDKRNVRCIDEYKSPTT